MSDQIYSPFLSLPAELRLMIFEFLWTPISQTLTYPINRIHHSSIPSTVDLSLLLTCHQIRAEAQKIAFRNHTFTISSLFSRADLKRISGQFPHNLITSIFIPMYDRESPIFKDLPATHPSRPHPTKLFHQLRRFVRLMPALQTIYCATASEPVRLGLIWRSMAAQTRFRCKIRNGRGKLVENWVGWDLTRVEEGGEGDMGNWELKTWAHEDEGQAKGEWKMVKLVVCGLDCGLDCVDGGIEARSTAAG